MVVFIAVAFLLICLSVDAVIQYRKSREAAKSKAASSFKAVLSERKLIIPKGIFFDKSHTWAYMDQYGYVKTGINDFLQHLTGPLTGVKLLSNGDRVKKGDKLLSVVQNGKQLNIYSPVSGKIKTCNKSLEKDASIINTSPYSEGWIYEIEPDNWLKETKLMFMAEKTHEWMQNEITRFKEFIVVMQTKNLELANVVMQDGGDIADNVLGKMGPEAWEEFQIGFIDKV